MHCILNWVKRLDDNIVLSVQGKLSEAWESVTKAAIAENILNLTRMDEKNRDPTKCLRSPTLWLALSSLCVLDSDHVERLSSGQWSSAYGQPPPPRVSAQFDN
jgi:E3 ubiquitin-protein ligase MYCBP2